MSVERLPLDANILFYLARTKDRRSLPFRRVILGTGMDLGEGISTPDQMPALRMTVGTMSLPRC